MPGLVRCGDDSRQPKKRANVAQAMTRWFFLLLLASGAAHADAKLVRQPAVQQFIHELVVHDHFKPSTLVTLMREAKYQPSIIASMERPYEKKSWDVYKQLFLTDERIKQGVVFWRMNQKALTKAQQQYGVSADMIVAIIGVETLYGQRQGNYRVLDALTTLAFYYPKRSAFFRKELKEYLLLCREQGVAATRYMGSYAGAIGKPQFMPSSYRYYAVDFTGNGKRDLIHDNADVIGSVANFFHHHGWRAHEDVAQLASVRGGLYQRLALNARSAGYQYTDLLKYGVKPLSPYPHHPDRAGLIALNTTLGAEYWLAYPNFYVITHYNTSPQYALVVYLLAEQWRKYHAIDAQRSVARI